MEAPLVRISVLDRQEGRNGQALETEQLQDGNYGEGMLQLNQQTGSSLATNGRSVCEPGRG